MAIANIITRRMSQNIVTKIVNSAGITEKRLVEMRSKLEEIKRIKVEEKIQQLTQENNILSSKVEKAKSELIQLETLNGKKQYSIPGKPTVFANSGSEGSLSSEQILIKTKVQEKIVTKKENDPVKKNKEKAKESTDTVDVRKLDFRIGKIVDINKHPDADTLYVERIDCGEENPRTVVSGLVNHIPIEEMRDRIVMVLCNLKPVKMRGVTSEAMVMCASTPEKVEVLIPPNGAVPGDEVTCDGYPREPEAQLNPKKKIFETCAPDLKTNEDKVACYKGSPLIVPGKGPVIAATLKGVSVK